MRADYPLNLSDYWTILWRRKVAFLIPFVLIFGGALALAFMLPPTYKSEVTFLVQRQSVPQNMVASTVSSYVQEQIEQIRQQIVTRDNLIEFAEKIGIYPEELQQEPGEVVSKLRDSIEVEMVDVRASDPERRTNEQITTIAFTVSFSAPTARLAQAGTDELAQRFLAAHDDTRRAQANEVAAFFEQEARQLQGQIAELEQQLATFKQEELRQLPELMSTNLRLYEKTEQDIEDTEEQIRSLRERIEVTRAELSLTSPYEEMRNQRGERVLSGSEKLSALTAQYFEASARYSAKHPDIIRLRREIQLLTERLGGADQAEAMLAELVDLQDQLRQARLDYSDDHPEVRRLERAVAAVQRGFRSEIVTGVADGPQAPPDNPRYVALQTQLESSEAALAAEQQKLADLRERLAVYEQRLAQTPVVERDFRAITRNHETALQQYNELRDKQRQAQLASTLEAGEGGQQFVLTGSAPLPALPDSPNRIGLGLLGMFLAVAGGIGSVTVAEYQDRTIRNARMIAATLGAPPLVVIPRMKPA